MERRLLEEIIALESALAGRIEAERAKAGAWLNEEQARIEADRSAIDDECGRMTSKALDAARHEARQFGEGLIAEARERASRMRAISDDGLRALVARHIGRVVS